MDLFGRKEKATTKPALKERGFDEGEVLLQRKPKVGEKEVSKAIEILQKYKTGKTNLEQRITEDEMWYKLRHWEVIRKNKNPKGPNPSSAWLFNTIMNKHADAVDNYPKPNILPREAADTGDAKMLSEVVPVVIERNGFEETYSDNWYEKLKHGTAAYGVFWDSEQENGLGDIAIKQVDLLNIFWEPGISDIQKSRYLFIVDLVSREELEAMYPEHKGKLSGNAIDVKQYNYDDTVDTTDKVCVVDCYYKVKAPSGRTLLHMLKFCGSTLLFASENDEKYAEGFYEHGMFPVVFDTLFPEKGTPVGFGYVAVCKDPQLYIDALGANILENSLMATKPRYFALKSAGINLDQFKDWNEQIIEVEGNSLDESRLRQIDVAPMSGIYASVYEMKINEMKETSSNRDVNSGGSAGSGVTAAAAIAALQEAGNKNSRDMISASYRAYTQVIYLAIELIRQFYDEKRTFRITGEGGNGYSFVDYSNAGIKEQEMQPAYPGAELEPDYVPTYRRPIFDIKVRAEKRNPFSQMSMNETAKELYRLGVFHPERAQEALIMLDMMEFEGIDSVREKVMQGETLLKMCQQLTEQLNQMSAMLGIGEVADGGTGTPHPSPAATPSPQGKGLGVKVVQAQQKNMTSYGERLAKRAVPSME
ncbi:MAG: hypothetical protein IJ299_05290 [Oscillospiraceae bacterium]|nr:hypothetical protein [Oscillospiraceae bacterium]